MANNNKKKEEEKISLQAIRFDIPENSKSNSKEDEKEDKHPLIIQREKSKSLHYDEKLQEYQPMIELQGLKKPMHEELSQSPSFSNSDMNNFSNGQQISYSKKHCAEVSSANPLTSKPNQPLKMQNLLKPNP